ncbi:MAG TPA: glycosyltransferase family 4 protein [Chthoniobacterales bacterium]
MAGKMKACMVAYAYYEGNGRIEQYAKALVRRGDSVDVIALDRGNTPNFQSVDGVNLYHIQTRKLRRESFSTYVFQVLMFMLRSFWFLAKKQFKDPYDVIHVHSVPDFLVFGALIPKLFHVPVILDIHDILPEFYLTKFGVSERSVVFKFLVLVEKSSIAFSNHVIIANPIWRERLLRRSAKPEKVTVIGNYPDPRKFFPRSKSRSDGKFILIYPGSLNWHQGLDIAIRGFARVIDEMPDAEFRIYGEGPERENLTRLARECGVEAKILFSDFLPGNEIAEIMATSDLAVVPKRAKSVFGTEAASTKIMEFMAVGVPVIVSRTKIDALYHTDATVKFFDSDDSEELAKAILFLYSNPASRAELVKNALAYVTANNWETKKIEYLAIVDRLIEKKVSANLPETRHSMNKTED